MNRTIILFLIVIVGMAKQIKAQLQGQARLDSMLIELPKAIEDTNKVKLLADISFTYNYINPDEGIRYGKQGLELSEKIKWRTGVAIANRAIGVNYSNGKSEHKQALNYYLKALNTFEELEDKRGRAAVLINIGTVYDTQSDYDKALEYYFKSLSIFEEINSDVGIANNLCNIGIVYYYQKDYLKALEYEFKSLKMFEKLGDKNSIPVVLNIIGSAYKAQEDYSKALNYFFKTLLVYEELDYKRGIAMALGNIGSVYKSQSDYPIALEYIKKALKMQVVLKAKAGIASNLANIGDVYLNIIKDSSAVLSTRVLAIDKRNALKQAKVYTDSAITIYKEIGDLNNLQTKYNTLSEIQTLLGDNKGALKSYKNYTIYKDSIFNMEKEKKLTQIAMQYDFDKKESIAKIEQEKKDAVAQKELQKQKLVRNGFLGGFVVVLLFAGVFFVQRKKIGKEKKISDAEKKRSDDLLLNILPNEVAIELKATGTAKAKAFTMVTVMFTDFKDFTKISEKISAELLVDEIHTCFSAFDNILQKYKIEKVKTIGDAYLCASGLPVSNYTHASDMLQAAFEIRNFMLQRKKEKLAKGEIPFELRIGIHTGPVVAGIVGVKKFAYDIWGDTVNIASRMESSGEAGKVNISGSTYELVKDKFNCIHRGKIEAKNKGEIDMYFVETVPDPQNL